MDKNKKGRAVVAGIVGTLVAGALVLGGASGAFAAGKGWGSPAPKCPVHNGIATCD